jgi:ABC-2 type transport system ATP-binding protein
MQVSTRPRAGQEVAMIEARGLTKRYGRTVAVDRLSFDVRPGSVTGFLGPNGSGKSTTMRMIMGLDFPHAGQARIGGRRYRELRWPLREVGALLEARAFHPGRSARAHLAALAASNDIAASRVDEVLGAVGLHGAAGRRAGKFSLGMAQRLGIAAALLGDPGVLLFDEPANGLDPEGIRWIRYLMKSLAAEGRVVFVSSHLISEVASTADRLIVIGAGKLLADTTVAELSAGSASLEDAFLDLTAGSAEYRAEPAGGLDDGPPGASQAGGYPSYPSAGRSS